MKIKMKRSMLLWIVIGVLFVMALFFVFRAGSVSFDGIQAASTTAKTAVSTSASSYSGMVGGC